MLLFYLCFSASIVMILSISILGNKVHQRFLKMAHVYNLLFFVIFLSLLFYQTKFLLDDLRQLSGLFSVEQTVEAKISSTVHVGSQRMKEEVLLDVPLINQLPELPRGCEVTSLAMLLGDAGINIDKMTLAKEVKKDPTSYQVKEGTIHFGNPHDGFVGDMYSKKNPGYGVYHQPIMELAERYLPGQIINLTDRSFEDLQLYLSNEVPIWVVINTTYKKLPSDLFQTWETPSGSVEITYKMHAVVITGYSNDTIYFNDPLSGTKNKKAAKADFIEAWIQMGSQAITYAPLS